VVIAPSPTLVAQAVEALVSLIRPLKYMSDYRPYFTIHDTEFKDITTKTQAPPAMIIGVTNPFFNKALDHWPHVLRLGEVTHSSGKCEFHASRNCCSKGWGGVRELFSKPVVGH
jgi:hypothetical protein